MKIKTSPDLKFTTTDKALISAFQKVSSITFYVDCLDSERKHLMVSYKGKAYVIGITPDAFACVLLSDTEVEAEGGVAFDLKVVQGLIKNVGTVEVYTDSGKLHFKATKGRYKANTEYVEVEPVDANTIKEFSSSESTTALSPEVIESLKEGLNSCELTNFYSDETILAFIDIGKTAISVACADNFHVAWYQNNIKTKTQARFAIPARTFSIVDKFVAGNKVEFGIGSGRMCIVGEEFILSLPEVQTEDDMFELVPTYVDSLDKSSTTIMISKSDMRSLENMFAITDEDTKLQMTLKDQKVKISLSTRSGGVSDMFKVKMKGTNRTVHIDPRIFNDLFKRVKNDDIPMSFHVGPKGASSCFMMKTAPSETSTLIQIGTFYDE